ncbi:hypothetical protein RSOLAG1IB_02930 [Rhizoctonia solani AG-1 IB]|uniref:Uncharacterized protein n=2 Tax=Rhizoctonia solani TaxID=456999 RepID=A0A8H2XHW6_9AGAM|nr:unnamed protein product [Rhizoctonia solani]CEL58185.1 hypothetical protein RSOLAG1IB_02930 [Rhizoctonia solani AG-1 IB]
MDALDLDHSYCARCETYIWPEKRQVEVQVPAKPTASGSSATATGVTKSKTGTIKASARRTDESADTVKKIRTVISLEQAPLYCSEKCRKLDQESGSANGRRIMEHFEPSLSPCSTTSSPISPSYDRTQHNMDYFTRIAGGSLPWTRRPSTTSTRSTTSMSSLELLEEHRQWSRALLAESAERLSHSESPAAISAESTTLPKPKSKPGLPKRDQDETPAPVPFTHRRWKEGGKDVRSEMTRSSSIDVDVAALYDQYPMSQRVRSTSSFGSGSSMRRGSMTASTVSDTASIRTTSSRGSTRRQGALSADATRGLLVPSVMIREDDCAHSISEDGEEPESYFMRRNRTITQRTHSYYKSTSEAPRSPKSRSDKTIQELVREARGPEYHKRQGSRPVSSLGDATPSGPLYEITRSPSGPIKRHTIEEVEVDGKKELRIVEQSCWEQEEPQKLFHFMI